jgi:hypothetical protein
MEWAFAYFTSHRRSRVILEVPVAPAADAKPSVIGQVIRLGSAGWNGRPAAGVAVPGPTVAADRSDKPSRVGA